MNVYALYEGDRSICDGTIYQIAEMTGLKPATLKWYGTPSGQRKGNMALVKIEEDDDMFLGSNIPRSKRSHSVYAPTLTNDGNERTEDVKVIFRHSQPVKWKPSEYVKSLHDSYFKGWNFK